MLRHCVPRNDCGTAADYSSSRKYCRIGLCLGSPSLRVTADRQIYVQGPPRMVSTFLQGLSCLPRKRTFPRKLSRTVIEVPRGTPSYEEAHRAQDRGPGSLAPPGAGGGSAARLCGPAAPRLSLPAKRSNLCATSHMPRRDCFLTAFLAMTAARLLIRIERRAAPPIG